MNRLTLLGILSAHASAHGSTPEQAWTIAADLAADAPAEMTEDWLQQACAYVSDRAAQAAWDPKAPPVTS